MILIVGGISQGKHDFCKNRFPDAEVIDHYEERIRRELEEGKDPLYEAEKWLNEVSGAKVMCDDADIAASFRGKTSNAYTETIDESSGQFVIIMNEVGSGVVPMDKGEREWREAVGRVSCLFAKKADRVYRLIAGIPQKLK